MRRKLVKVQEVYKYLGSLTHSLFTVLPVYTHSGKPDDETGTTNPLDLLDGLQKGSSCIQGQRCVVYQYMLCLYMYSVDSCASLSLLRNDAPDLLISRNQFRYIYYPVIRRKRSSTEVQSQ